MKIKRLRYRLRSSFLFVSIKLFVSLCDNLLTRLRYRLRHKIGAAKIHNLLQSINDFMKNESTTFSSA